MSFGIELIRGVDNLPIQGNIEELASKHIDDFVNFWSEELQKYQTQDKQWDWLFKLNFIKRNSEFEGYALVAEDSTQGLMKIETQLHSSHQVYGQKLVYVEFLASAPWNRSFIQRPPKFRGVGTNLLRYARVRSVELGYGGRVGLHSLPESVRFYENQLMNNFGLDENKDNLIYFEYGRLGR
ncbi:GNAT family N-acetyltransferase [Nostoc sp. FACHB-152]|uniref:GNAT family N-acetyltransferase n=1 Tax=Nostoc sp. FACHB-152 TaxID=2692837 RepID=UPI001687F5A4|nr:GNAT family N-acetyltransferase [Nostoc sp. FACHB-152]MBD2452308.1 GNAT family N-acetyltransferase [Nostoc sp. FACHB-152]